MIGARDARQARSLAFPQPDPRSFTVLIDEDDASGFERTAQVRDRSSVWLTLPCLEIRDRGAPYSGRLRQVILRPA